MGRGVLHDVHAILGARVLHAKVELIWVLPARDVFQVLHTDTPPLVSHPVPCCSGKRTRKARPYVHTLMVFSFLW